MSFLHCLLSLARIDNHYLLYDTGKEYVDEDLHQIVIDLGGRLTELELLIQKMKMNMNPKAAFEDIVQRNVVEIRKYGFKEAVETDDKYSPQWSAIQFWEIVKGLASSKSVSR